MRSGRCCWNEGRGLINANLRKNPSSQTYLKLALMDADPGYNRIE